ncbi:hypothetical protein [Paractinoplanes rishiriensis]|uniref:Uncharacterized protein n=1 Tax=Paractinoplanes rishiriensis TaxID=1050105 RepID=A0A919KDC8_9ACTN|nr:hypothetical protein [Actinoplanes rishiriensis]GIF02252.1 hypothetical protein Ari01nite_97160 [Actinoplanes rishiriensis]
MTTYDRALVKRLLPAVWDSNYAYGMTDTGPTPGMPRAQVDPAHAGTLFAHIADIKTGWTKAPLRDTERKAILMRYGLDIPEEHVAQMEGVTRQAINYRVKQGVRCIVATLNGEPD